MTDTTTSPTAYELPPYVPATPPPYVPAYRAGYNPISDALVDDLRSMDAKPLARDLVEVVRCLGGIVVELHEELREEMLAREVEVRSRMTYLHEVQVDVLRYLTKSLSRDVRAADSALLDLVANVVAELRRDLGLVEGRQTEVERTVRTIPTSLALDADALAARVAEQVIAAVPPARRAVVKDVLRDADGEIVRTVETEVDLDDLDGFDGGAA